METLFIILVIIGFGYLLWENYQFKRTIQTKNKAYDDLMKAYKQEHCITRLSGNDIVVILKKEEI